MWTVAQLAAELDKGRLTSRELLEQALARIADGAGEGKRAFLKVYSDSARADADDSDRLRRSGVRRSPVEGLPVSLKDLFDVAGDVTRAGSRILEKNPPAKADAAAELAIGGACDRKARLGGGFCRVSSDEFSGVLLGVRMWDTQSGGCHFTSTGQSDELRNVL